jgi:peroxiredoxin
VIAVTLACGDRAPDLGLLTPDGAQTSLGAFRGEATVLIFLRHLR